MSSGELEHTLLPKTIALPVFASDPLSSIAYATQEIAARPWHCGTVPWRFDLIDPDLDRGRMRCWRSSSSRIARRCRRTRPAEAPTGCRSENLGMYAGLLAAAALLIDYVLTVAVSITAGVDAIVSAAPGLDDHRRC